MITKVLSQKGQEISKKDTFEKLVALNPKDRYNKQKAAGSIGGSRTHRYIEVDGTNYKCTRDSKVATA